MQTKMRPVDLHVHSSRSDGSLSPAQLVDYAMEKGLAAIALTDHDTVDGLEEAICHAERLRTEAPAPEQVPEVVPGIELSSEYHGHDIHVLGLYIDYRNPDFQSRLRKFVDDRDARNQKMCRLLRDAGISVTYEELQAEFPGAVITRAHYAKYMLAHGYVKTLSEAFERYIGDGCPCYLPREKITPLQAVQLILDAKGIPILAHPILYATQYQMSDGDLDALAAQLKETGLIGLEAIYNTSSSNEADERRMRTLAKKYGLLLSGGSDFHGSNKSNLDMGTGYGRLYVPYSVLEDIKKAAKT